MEEIEERYRSYLVSLYLGPPPPTLEGQGELKEAMGQANLVLTGMMGAGKTTVDKP